MSLLGAAVLSSAVGYAAQALVGGQTATQRRSVISAALPGGWDITEIVSVEGGPTLFATKSEAGGPTRCAYLGVNEDTLHIASVQSVSCVAESALGAPIALVIEYVHGPYEMQAHIARISPDGKATVGPSVMAIPFVSDTRPVWAVGGDSAWLYDVATPEGPLLLQVSPVTGRVERSIPIPVKLYRPVMVADRAGVWIGVTPGGASGESGSPIYFVPSSSGKPTLAWSGGVSDFWAYSDANQVWFAVYTAGLHEVSSLRLIRFDGSDTRPSENIVISGANASRFGSLGDVVGDGAVSVWTLTWPENVGEGAGCGPAAVERLDLSNGTAEVVGHVRPPTTDYFDTCDGLDNGQAVVIQNYLYVLTDRVIALLPAKGYGYGRISSVNVSTTPPKG